MLLSKLYVSIVIISVLCAKTQTAKILMIWPSAAKSHNILADALMEELASNNHQITKMSPFENYSSKTNIRTIKLNGIQEVMKKRFPKDVNNFLMFGKLSRWEQMVAVSSGGELISEQALSQPGVQKLLNDPNEHFDLIILEMFHSEVFFGFAHKFNAPVVILGTMGSGVWTNHFVGNPAPSSYVPDFYTGSSSKMNLMERIFSTSFNLMSEIYRKYYYFPKLDKILHKHFPDAPNIFPLMYNRTALILLNSHPVITLPVPHVPAMVEIGGYHVVPPKPLPNNLQKLMDEAKDGVVLFSLGSNARSVDLSSEVRNGLLKAFAKLKQTVIWKFEEDLPNKPENVHIMDWCPQNDIMAHPNLKLFISHGGLLSTIESVYHGVPIIGIPIFADQMTNIQTIIEKGYGLKLSIDQITETNVYNTIQEVLMNSKYQQNINIASNILRNQPLKPMSLAMYWIEHVIKHRGANLYRSPAMDLEWYQIYYLDIIITLLTITSLIGYCIKFIINYILKHILVGKEKTKNA